LIQRLKSYLSLVSTRFKPQRHLSLDNLREDTSAELASIGLILQKARLEQNLSFKKISFKTLIPSDILQAIEDGNLGELPEPVYLKITIKKYSDFLNVDLKNSLENLYPKKPAQNGRFSNNFLKLPAFEFRPVYFYFFYILIVILSVHKIASSLEESANFSKINQNNPIEYKQSK